MWELEEKELQEMLSSREPLVMECSCKKADKTVGECWVGFQMVLLIF